MWKLEKWKYWILRISGKYKKQCRSFCVMCEYYNQCRVDG